MDQMIDYGGSDTRIDTGMKRWREGDLEAALGLFRAEPDDSSMKLIASVNEAQVCFILGDLDGAIAACNAGLAHFSRFGTKHPVAVVQQLRVLGQCHCERGEYSIANEFFEEGLRNADSSISSLQADETDYSIVIAAIEMERAHTLNSQGGMLLKALEPEEAVQVLERARTLHARVQNPVGWAETLTHLAQAKTMLGDSASAAYLLEEALEIVEETGDTTQRFRIVEARLRCSDAPTETIEKAAATARDAALASEQSGHVATAYVRWCMAADWAHRTGNALLLDESLAAAAGLEEKLDEFDLHRPALTLLRGRRELEKGDHQQALGILYEGCLRWQTVVAGMGAADVKQVMRKAHELYLLLTKLLVEGGDYNGGLAVLEAGHAIAFAMETHGAVNVAQLWPLPLALADAGRITERLRERLTRDQAILVPTLLPGLLCCFIITDEEVSLVQRPIPAADEGPLFAALDGLPDKLDRKTGSAAIPELVKELGELIVGSVGQRRIVGVAPHSLLHAVPWRALLKHLGKPWAALPLAIDFALHAWIVVPSAEKRTVKSARSLAHGKTVSVNFADEALEFAISWGGSCDCDVATLENLHLALLEADVVHLSCHGIGFAEEFAFDLDGIAARVEALVGDTVLVTDTLLLSVCNSGTYFVRAGDHPIGAAPTLLRHGVRACLCTRFPIDARFAARLLPRIGSALATGAALEEALSKALEEEESGGVADFWSDLACVEIVRARPST